MITATQLNLRQIPQSITDENTRENRLDKSARIVEHNSWFTKGGLLVIGMADDGTIIG